MVFFKPFFNVYFFNGLKDADHCSGPEDVRLSRYVPLRNVADERRTPEIRRTILKVIHFENDIEYPQMLVHWIRSNSSSPVIDSYHANAG